MSGPGMTIEQYRERPGRVTMEGADGADRLADQLDQAARDGAPTRSDMFPWASNPAEREQTPDERALVSLGAHLCAELLRQYGAGPQAARRLR
jgi:hypothetical protein